MYFVSFKTQNTTSALALIAARTLMLSYWERMESMVVKAPAPAISGKTTGKKLLSFGLSVVVLKISISRIISKAITKIISEPATAKEEMVNAEQRQKGFPDIEKDEKHHQREQGGLSGLDNFSLAAEI